MHYLLVLYLKDISGVCSPAVLSHLIYIATYVDVVFVGFWCYFKFLVKQKIKLLESIGNIQKAYYFSYICTQSSKITVKECDFEFHFCIYQILFDQGIFKCILLYM